MLRMTDVPLAGKRVLIRTDLNVPLHDGRILDDTRLRATLPTFRAATEAGAGVLVVSHLGRPREGAFDPALSLRPVAEHLATLLHMPVRFAAEWIDGVELEPGTLTVGENVRFLRGEKQDDEALARRMAALCDVYVMDAFGAAHRAQASTHAVARYAPVACAGPLLAEELDAIARVMQRPQRPLLAVVGGAKVSSKLKLLKALLERVDQLVVGGGIANTFLAAAGHPIGHSLYEPDLMGAARELMARARELGKQLPLPERVVVAPEIGAHVPITIKHVDEVDADEMILDVAPDFAEHVAGMVKAAGTLVWNGPLGVFEYPPFSAGTHRLALAVAESEAYSLCGGGETLAAIAQFGIGERVSYISTGGGALLEALEGRTLPAVAALEARAAG